MSTSSFPICTPFISFLDLVDLAKASHIVLDRMWEE